MHCSCSQRVLGGWTATRSLRLVTQLRHSAKTRVRSAGMASEASAEANKALLAPGEAKAKAVDMLEFINAAWTPYHAVEEASKRLMAAGFTHIAEKDAWNLQPGGKYFFTRNMSTIVAFAIGQKYQAGNPFCMIGAHTDSPCLKVKPVSKSSSAGCQTLNIETYGGGLWHTWFDRDLGLAGRVLVREQAAADASSSNGSGGKLQHRLVKIDKPVLRIPMLAIHLNRNLYTDGFKPNLQDHLKPVLCTIAKAPKPAAAPSNGTGPSVAPSDVTGSHHALLLSMVADELGCQPTDIVDFELNLCDVQPGVLGGVQEEFLFVGRLDNLGSCYTALEALIDSVSAPDALADEHAVRSVAFFDHEEVGSDSAQGAGGPVMRDTITRVARVLSQVRFRTASGSATEPDMADSRDSQEHGWVLVERQQSNALQGQEGAVERTLRQSFLVSADMAHALHPNYTDKHDSLMAPAFQGGLVLKHNNNQRYATNAISAALFREVGRRAGVPVQEFAVRNDMPCGSTIGPILAHNLGCRTVDVGMPQLSMHSIREMAGVDDVLYGYKHFKEFFSTFSAVDASLDVDSLPPPDIKGTIRDPACSHCKS